MSGEPWVCCVGGGAAETAVVGGWGAARAARAAAWVAGAGERDLARADAPLRALAAEPWPCARGLLLASEGYRLLALACRHWAERAPPPEPFEARAQVAAALAARGRPGLPGAVGPAAARELERLGRELEAAAAASSAARAGPGDPRPAICAAIRAAGAWADEAERFLGRLAEAAAQSEGAGKK